MRANKLTYRDIILIALTSIFTIAGSLIVYYFTNQSPKLTYEILPISYFKKDSFQISIINVRVINEGAKECEDVYLNANFGDNSEPKEFAFEKSSTNIKINKYIDSSSHKTYYSIPYLNPNEQIICSFLINKIVDQKNILVDLRGKGTNAVKYLPSDKKVDYIYLLGTLVMVSLTLGIVFFVLFHQRTVTRFNNELIQMRFNKLTQLLKDNNIPYDDDLEKQ